MTRLGRSGPLSWGASQSCLASDGQLRETCATGIPMLTEGAVSLFKVDGKGKSVFLVARGLATLSYKRKALEYRKIGCPRNRPENHHTPETVIFIFAHIGQKDFFE